jgi:hypothetical protein
MLKLLLTDLGIEKMPSCIYVIVRLALHRMVARLLKVFSLATLVPRLINDVAYRV